MFNNTLDAYMSVTICHVCKMATRNSSLVRGTLRFILIFIDLHKF